jgi:hypothetical protein
MDSSTVRGRKIQYIKLFPTNAKDQRKSTGIDVQTKHIYNLIEIGKKGTKTTLTVNSFQNQSAFIKKSIYFCAK